MNEYARPFAIVALLFALLAGGCGQRAEETPPLKGASMGGPFTLTGEDGRRVSDREFAGKYRLVYFGFTYCPDVCPTDMAVLGGALRRFEAADPARAARVQPLFISVDPARDTPAVLRRFTDAFHPRFLGLTGSEAEIAQVAHRYGIYYEREPANAAGAYNVNHQRQAVLYGPDGAPIAILLPREPSAAQGAEGVAADLERWVR
ncbi:MAG TPA: SCO family protein [Allosphingosinicella sp.]|nr:SCO family protein [Allosphingosinicella sp.]